MENAPVVSGVAHDYNVAKIGLFDVPDKPGVAMKIFKALSAQRLNVDMIIQSAMRNNMNDIGFTVTHDDLRKTLQTIEAIQEKWVSKATPTTKTWPRYPLWAPA